MKNHNLSFLVAVVLLSSLLAQACGNSPDKALRNGVRLFKDGKTPEARTLITHGLLTASGVKSFRPPYPECRGNVLFKEGQGGVKISFPDNLSLKGIPPLRMICRNKDDGMMLLAGEKKTLLADKKGRVSAERPLDTGVEPVMACLWDRDRIILYRGDTIYRMDPASGDTRALLPEQRFPPPFSKSKFTVTFSLDDSTLAVAVGIAGSYNLYGLNLRASSSLFTKRSCSSSRILVDRGTFYYITGSAGSWTLSSFMPARNERKDLRAFSSLLDIEMVPGCLIYESREGTFISGLDSQDDIPLPFVFKIAGQCDGLVMGEHGGRLHLVDMTALYKKTKLLREEIPDFFSGKSSSPKKEKQP